MRYWPYTSFAVNAEIFYSWQLLAGKKINANILFSYGTSDQKQVVTLYVLTGRDKTFSHI
jgi:hypothetical protein